MSFTPNDTRIYVQGFPARQIISLLCDGFCRIFFFPVAYQRDDPPLSGGSEVNYSTCGVEKKKPGALVPVENFFIKSRKSS